MPRFRFQFDSLLRLRESERDTARQAIADAFQALKILQQQRLELEQQRQQLRAQAQQRLSGSSLSVDALLHQGRYDMQLAVELQGLIANTASVQTEIERRQSRLQAADTEVKRLERLKERRHQEWIDVERAAQQTELDEIASTRFARSRVPKRTDSWQ